MYIVAIGWLFVTSLMALTETSVVAGVATLLFYGLLPLALLLYLMGTPQRRRNRRAREAREARAAATESDSPSIRSVDSPSDSRDDPDR